MKKVFFIVFIFPLVCFGQFGEKYKIDLYGTSFSLEAILEDDFDNTYYSSEGEPLLPYKILNINEFKIGTLELSKDKKQFRFLNNKSQLVAQEQNVLQKDDFFDYKSSIGKTLHEIDNDILFIRKWNKEKNRFDLFKNSSSTILMGVMNQDSQGRWQVLRKKSYYASIFAYLFDSRRTLNNNSSSKEGNNTNNKNSSSNQANRIVVNSNTRGANTSKTSGPTFASDSASSDYNYDDDSPYGPSLNLSLQKRVDLKYKNEGLLYNSMIRLGAEWYLEDQSVGVYYGFGKSDTAVTDEYGISDMDISLSYGRNIISNLIYVKGGLGYYSLNYDFTESFGPFYEIENGVYYSLGIQFYIPISYSGITIESYYNNYGIGYGVGFKF